MPNNPRIDIAVQVQYKEILDQMTKEFKQNLTEISNHAKKAKIDADIREQIKQIKSDIATMSKDFKNSFEEINTQTINTKNFEEYQNKVSNEFDKMKESISGVAGEISTLRQEVGMLDGTDFVSNAKKQFDELFASVKNTHKELGQVLDFTKSSSMIDSNVIKQADTYRRTIEEIRKLQSNAELPDVDVSDIEKAVATYKRLSEEFQKLEDKEFYLFEQYEGSSGDDRLKIEKELYSVRQQMVNQLEIIQELYKTIGSQNLDGLFDPNTTVSYKSDIEEYIKNGTEFIQQNEKMIQSYKETQSQLDASATEFKLKNGAIHIPVKIDEIDGIKEQIVNTIKKLQNTMDSKPIIAKVKLVLEGNDAKGRKKNIDFDQQQIDGQDKKSVDLAPVVKKAVRDGAKIAEETVNEALATIRKKFEEIPIAIHPDSETFKKELEAMVDDAFKSIAENSTGLNVNEQLEKLVSNLKEVSTSLSGSEGFKFGLDEASIKRITDAIEGMADMIQRAFNVASKSDIDAQWAVIEDKFNNATNDKGNILKSNKVALQELAVEYKKYLDMGGKNDLSALTTHKQTIKNITAEYEELGKVVQEVTEKQKEQAEKKPKSKISTEEKDAIKGVTRENKNLEGQADKTSNALKNEGKSAETAAGKFRKLAKEKGAAAYANRELAKAAKETAAALEKEANLRKESGAKRGKNAVDDILYADNFLKWESQIKQSLLDSGNYAEVYEAKITQAANGNVKFTAIIRDLNGELKKFSATVNDSGNITAPSISEMSEKQALTFEKRLMDAKRLREVLEAFDGEEPTFFDRTELERYVEDILKAEDSLDKFIVKKVSLGSGGSLSITSEFEEANGQIKTFTAQFSSIEDILDETTGFVKNLSDVLEDAFNSGKFTVKTRNIADEAQNMLDKFKSDNADNSNLSHLVADLDKLENSIVNIGNQDGLDNFIKELSNIGERLDYISKASRAFSLFELANKDDANYKEVAADVTALFNGLDKIDTQEGLDKFKKDLSDIQDRLSYMSKAQRLFDVFKLDNESNINFTNIAGYLDIIEGTITSINNQDGLDKFKRDLSDIGTMLANISKAQRAFDLFEMNYAGDGNYNEILGELVVLLNSIGDIDSQEKLDKFNHSLSELGAKLKTIASDDKLGELFKTNQSFTDIKEVSDYLDVLLADIGEVNKKSIEIKGLKTLTAEVKDANGEIHKMIVNLDSNNFARFIDKGTKPKPYNAEELDNYVSSIRNAIRELDTLDTKYKVSMKSDGSLSITKEVQEANGEVKIFTANFKDIESVIDTTTGSVKELKDVLKDAFDSGKVSTKTRDLAKEAQDIFDAFNTKNKNNNNLGQFAERLEELRQGINGIDNLDKLDEFKQKLTGIAEELKKATDVSKLVSQAQTAFDKFEYANKEDSNWSKIETQVAGLKERIKSIGDQTALDEFKHDLLAVEELLKNINRDANLGSLFEGVTRSFKDINEVRDNINSLFASIGRVNEKSIRVKDMNTLTAEVAKANGEVHKFTVTLDSVDFARFVDNGVVELSRLEQTSKKILGGIGSLVRIYLSPQDFIRYFRQGFDAIKEIDTAMTELKKVSDATAPEIAAYFDDAVESAKELGSSVKDMISATADWSRLGYNLPDAKELGEVAVLYKNVGDGIDIDTANESLVSTIQGFQLQAKDALSVIDSFNEVSKLLERLHSNMRLGQITISVKGWRQFRPSKDFIFAIKSR